jgi:hypothetical protein
MEIKSCLAKVTFPMDKKSLVEYAKKNCGKEEADVLRKIKEKQYASVDEVSGEIEGSTEIQKM